MGTNYNYHINVCEHCKRSEQSFHIGKNSAGWTFSFQAYYEVRSPDINGEIIPIQSFSDWKNFFNSVPGEIRDEYNEVISVKDFIELVESKKTEKYNHAQCLRDAKNGDKEAQTLWGFSFPYDSAYEYFIDAEGNAFQYKDFC